MFYKSYAIQDVPTMLGRNFYSEFFTQKKIKYFTKMSGS